MSTSSPTFLGPKDAPAQPLAGETVAVLGYGNLGRTVALNLRDSGVTVIVGNRDDEYAEQARGEGFDVRSVAEASKADVVFVLLPDEVIPEVFPAEIGPYVRDGAALAFGSGYTLAYDLITPSDQSDVLLVAPRMAGETARQRFEKGDGFWAYVGVERDASGKAEARMLGLAAGIGALRQGAMLMSAEMEATIDLFIEQTVGPVLGAAIMLAHSVGVAAGIPGPALCLEMYMNGEFETVFQSFREQGFFAASEAHGPTALFGGMIRTMELDRGAMTKMFESVIADIKSGGFAEKFQAERAAGYPMLAMARSISSDASPQALDEQVVRDGVAGG